MNNTNQLHSTIESLHAQIVLLTAQLQSLSVENANDKEINRLLIDQIAFLTKQIQELLLQISKLNETNSLQAERIADLTRRLFGRKSEKTKHMRDVEMAAEPGLFDNKKNQADKADASTKRKKKEKGLKEQSISHLESEDEIHLLNGVDRMCPKCGKEMSHMTNRFVRPEVVYIPARLVKKMVYQEVCHCDCHNLKLESKVIVSAQIPKQPLTKTMASPSLLAQIIHQKFSLYTPIYRQNDDWKRLGLPTGTRNLCSWVNKAAQNVLSLIYKRLNHYLKREEILHADETTFKINKDEHGNQLKSKSYMWQIRTGHHSQTPMVYFYPHKSRGESVAQFLLESFEGFCHVDMHHAYKKIPGITLIGCIGHLRRYFFEAVEVAGKGAAATGLAYLNQLFILDRVYAGKEPEEVKKLRLEESKPIFEAFYDWVESLGNIGNGKFAKAVGYALNNKDYFFNVYLDGRLQLSNNQAEALMKPIALGRKNYLFADTQIGAQSNAIHHTIVETAELNGLDPYKYLEFLLDIIPNSEYMKEEVIDEFLPWNEKVQEICKKIEMAPVQ